MANLRTCELLACCGTASLLELEGVRGCRPLDLPHATVMENQVSSFPSMIAVVGKAREALFLLTLGTLNVLSK
jgi:hypothetical protein